MDNFFKFRVQVYDKQSEKTDSCCGIVVGDTLANAASKIDHEFPDLISMELTPWNDQGVLLLTESTLERVENEMV